MFLDRLLLPALSSTLIALVNLANTFAQDFAQYMSVVSPRIVEDMALRPRRAGIHKALGHLGDNWEAPASGRASSPSLVDSHFVIMNLALSRRTIMKRKYRAHAEAHAGAIWLSVRHTGECAEAEQGYAHGD